MCQDGKPHQPSSMAARFRFEVKWTFRNKSRPLKIIFLEDSIAHDDWGRGGVLTVLAPQAFRWRDLDSLTIVVAFTRSRALHPFFSPTSDLSKDSIALLPAVSKNRNASTKSSTRGARSQPHQMHALLQDRQLTTLTGSEHWALFFIFPANG